MLSSITRWGLQWGEGGALHVSLPSSTNASHQQATAWVQCTEQRTAFIVPDMMRDHLPSPNMSRVSWWVVMTKSTPWIWSLSVHFTCHYFCKTRLLAYNGLDLETRITRKIYTRIENPSVKIIPYVSMITLHTRWCVFDDCYPGNKRKGCKVWLLVAPRAERVGRQAESE